MEGIIESIFISANAGGEVISQPSVKLEAGRGIVGDRYYLSKGTYSEKLKNSQDFEVTLIEREEIDVFNQATGLDYDASAFRRNLVTRDIRLNDLVGKEFSIGDVKFKGMRL
jgi:hypothetical protein